MTAGSKLGDALLSESLSMRDGSSMYFGGSAFLILSVAWLFAAAAATAAAAGVASVTTTEECGAARSGPFWLVTDEPGAAGDADDDAPADDLPDPPSFFAT